MQRAVWAGVAVVLVCSLAGCASAPKSVGKGSTMFDQLQQRANEITSKGGLAAVGLGTSETMALAIDKAKTRGRTELAHVMETKVDSLKKDFQEEIGEGSGAELNTLFSAASKSIAHQILRGSVPKDVKFETEGKSTTAVALMVQDPKVIKEALDQQKNTAAAVYTRFRASQAFKELDDECKKYEEFKQKDMGGAIAQ